MALFFSKKVFCDWTPYFLSRSAYFFCGWIKPVSTPTRCDLDYLEVLLYDIPPPIFLRQAGFHVTTFERLSTVGGVWFYQEDEGPMYTHLVTNLPKVLPGTTFLGNEFPSATFPPAPDSFSQSKFGGFPQITITYFITPSWSNPLPAWTPNRNPYSRVKFFITTASGQNPRGFEVVNGDGYHRDILFLSFRSPRDFYLFFWVGVWVVLLTL